MFESGGTSDKSLWDHKQKLVVDKLKDKTPPVPLQTLENNMSHYKEMIEFYQSMPREKTAFFFSEIFESVIEAFKNQAESWLDKYGSVLRELSTRELESIRKEIAEYRAKLEDNPTSIVGLKALLNSISQIKSHSMIMEFRISEVVEKFRTLSMYKQAIDAEYMAEAFDLEAKWKELITDAKNKDAELIVSKQEFAKETQGEVAQFKAGLVILYKEYKETGPGSANTSLDDGLDLLESYKEKIAQLNRKKEELVLAEKLFNLDISNFPELVHIEEENKQLQPLYDLYKEVKTTMKDFSLTLWVKLDSEQLQKTGDKFASTLKKKLAPKYQKNPVYEKLFSKITAFRESIPLIAQLKSGSITDRHWEKLMRETGKKFEASIKTMTLEQVFALNLQTVPDKVAEICNEANQEHKNEEELNKIDQVWKKENFDLKFSDKRNCWELDNTAEKKELLEDQLANLQTVASSKYVSAFVNRIRNWEKGLNLISECIDTWLIVQKRWQDLVPIYVGNEDIRQQLK